METLTREQLENAGVGAFFRPTDVQSIGLTHYDLQKLVAQGTVEKVGEGLYRLTEVEPTELETVAMVATAAPKAIICLITALHMHNIGTQISHQVWIGLDRKARKPVSMPAKVRVVRFSGAMLKYGVESRKVLGVNVWITSPARTVVDCFRYRNKIGLDVALEALRDSLRSKTVRVAEIVRAAEVCRARTVMHRYLEAIDL